MQRLEARLAHPGLKGDQWKAVAGELQDLRDQDPDCANAHVVARRCRLHDAAAAAGVKASPTLSFKGSQHRPVIDTRWFENHMLTEGLKDGAEEGELRVTTHVELPINLTLLIGGLSRMNDDLSDAQRAAAAIYRSLYETASIGGARAIDYGQARVDTSAKATNPADGGIDARRRYYDAVRTLGMVRSSMIENVVCHDMSVRDLAKRMGVPAGGRSSQRVKAQLFDAVDTLVDHFGTVPQAGRARVRRAGDRAMDWSAEEIDDSEQPA